MANVPKLYWALCALGLPAEARRLRKEEVAARDGDPEAQRRLQASVRRLGWALDALGSSEEARQLRQAAFAARAGNAEARAHLDRVSSLQQGSPGPEQDSRLPPGEVAAAPAPARGPDGEAAGDEASLLPVEAAGAATAPAAVGDPAVAPARSPAPDEEEVALVLARPTVPAPDRPPAPAERTPHAGSPPVVPARTANLSPGRRQFSMAGGGVLARSRRRWGRPLAAALLLLALLGAGILAARSEPVHQGALAGAWSRGRAHGADAWRWAAAAVRRAAGAVAGLAPSPPPSEPAPAPVPPVRAPPRKDHPRAARAPVAVPAEAEPGPHSGAPAGSRYLWRAGNWGMTEAEILRAFPGATSIGGPAPAGEALAARAALEGVRMAGQSWSALFLFDAAGRLGAIQLRPAGPPATAGRAHDDLAAALTADYGRPRREGPEVPAGSGSRLTWSTADADVELRDEEVDPARARVLAVDFGAGDLRPLPDRGVVLTLGPPARPAP